jgi:PAS domain S-box-containing protein
MLFRSIHPDDLCVVVTTFDARRSSHPPVHVEYRIATSGSKYIRVADQVRTAEDERGTVTHRGLMTGITERKAAYEKIREEANLLDEVGDAIIVCSLDHHIMCWDRSAERIYGWSEVEMLNAGLRTHLHYNAADQYAASYQADFRDGAHEEDLQLATRSGKTLDTIRVRPLSGTMTPFPTLCSPIAHDLNNVLAPIFLATDMLRRRAVVPHGKRARVLLIDDEAAILKITRATLELHGYVGLTAHNGTAGLGIYSNEREQIQVVFADLMMPVRDGAVAIRALRRIDPIVKIVAVSGLVQSIDSPLAADTTACLHMPLDAAPP